MAGFTAALGIGSSLLGGFMKSKAQNTALQNAQGMAQWNPYNIRGPSGNVSFRGQNINASLTPEQQRFANQFSGGAQALLGGQGANQSYINFANTMGQRMPGLFSGAMSASGQMPLGAADMFSQFSAQNALGAQGMGFDQLAQMNQLAGQQGGINEGIAQNLFGRGFGALDDTDYGDLAAQQIQMQRDFARPTEERAVNSKFQNLFNRGALSSTSGERQLGDLALSQEMADIGRVSAGQQFADRLREQNRGFGLNAIGQGIGARQQDLSGNLQRAGLFANAGQGLLSFGQNAGQQGLGAQFDISNLINQRAQQRFSNANQMFGFGQAASQQNLNNALQMFGGFRDLGSDLRAQTALAGNISSGAATANNNAASYAAQNTSSPFGSLLSGFGGAMMGLGG